MAIIRFSQEPKMFTRIILTVAACGALTFLVACSGTIDGVVRGEGSRVTFLYKQGMDRDFYEATIDGEHFKGQAIQADARTGSGVGFFRGTTVPVITSSTSGNIVAVMFGEQRIYDTLQNELCRQLRVHSDGRGRNLSTQRWSHN